jgi:hypothetical protein
VFAADVTLDGESLTDTLHALRDSIAAVDPEHPSTVSLQRIDELNWTEGIVVNGDLIPHEPNPGFPFLLGRRAREAVAGRRVRQDLRRQHLVERCQWRVAPGAV